MILINSSASCAQAKKTTRERGVSQAVIDARFMALALSLGARGLGRVWPNPAVGCVIVKEGRIVGRGRTADGGRPHAETVALDQAGEQARGSTVYVTLEPCAHHGKTPPCAEALVRAGVARVVTALDDPDSRVSGRGHAILRQAGIELARAVGADQARQTHSGFLQRLKQGRPMLTLKIASSFDGRIATRTGESQWITGPQARRMVHLMRARHDAVLVGGGTARQDDPSLTVRGLGIARQPVRVVASRQLDLPLGGKLALTAFEVPLWICHGADAGPALLSAWRGLGAELLPCEARQGRLAPEAILQALGAAGLTRVFCEGGGEFAASLLNAGLVDQVIGFSAGLAIGAEGLASLGAMGVQRLDAAPRFELAECKQVGGDVMHRWRRV